MGIAIKNAGDLKSVTYHRPGSVSNNNEEEDDDDNERDDDSISSDGIPEITRVVYSSSNWNKDHPPMFLEVLIDPIEMPLDKDMVLIFEDTIGNRSELNYWPFIIDYEIGIPVVHIVLPLDNEVITNDFAISGVMYTNDAIKQIY
jgi:hypothetical protein